jgi:hypothetical protein
MRWTVHIPFRPLPWRGLLSALCYLYATAHRAPAMTDSGACHCSCRRGALCVHALRLQACRSESEPGQSNAIC